MQVERRLFDFVIKIFSNDLSASGTCMTGHSMAVIEPNKDAGTGHVLITVWQLLQLKLKPSVAQLALLIRRQTVLNGVSSFTTVYVYGIVSIQAFQ